MGKKKNEKIYFEYEDFRNFLKLAGHMIETELEKGTELDEAVEELKKVVDMAVVPAAIEMAKKLNPDVYNADDDDDDEDEDD